MNKIMLASLMILIAGPVHAMNDNPDREAGPNDIELGAIQSRHSSDRSQTAYDDNVLRYRGGPINRTVTPTDDSEISYDNDSRRPDEDRRPIINVQVPAPNNTTLNEHLYAIGDKLGDVKSVLERIRWSKLSGQLAQPFYTIGLICMICSAGQGIQNAISSVGNNLGNNISGLHPACQCQCSCPACPTLQDLAPTPMQMMYNDTMNSTVNSMNSTSNSTATNSTTFLAMMNNMTKQKTD